MTTWLDENLWSRTWVGESSFLCDLAHTVPCSNFGILQRLSQSSIGDSSMLLIELHRGQAGFARVLPLRRLVFVEQEGYMNAASPLLEDEYDWAQNTFHVL